jgi:hypothetical protein
MDQAVVQNGTKVSDLKVRHFLGDGVHEYRECVTVKAVSPMIPVDQPIVHIDS